MANARWPLAALLIAPIFFGAPFDRANAGCRYSVKGNYICIVRVMANPRTPHLNTAYTTFNGQPVTMKVDCSDFTFNMGDGWVKFEIDSPIHEVCSKWSF